MARRMLRSPLAAVFFALVASQAGLLVLSLVLVDVSRTFDTSTSAAGQLRTVAGIAAGATALALVRIGGRAPLRGLLLGGAGLLAVGSLGSAVAPSLVVLGVFQTATGIAAALLHTGGTAAAAAWAPEGARTRALSVALLGPGVAWVVGMPVAGLAASASWRLVFVAVPLVSAVLALAFVRAAPRSQTLPAAEAAAPPDRTFAAWCLAELLASGAWGGLLVFSGALLIESYGIGAATAGAILSVFALAYLAGNVLARRLIDADPERATVALALTVAGSIVLVGAVRPSAAVTTALLCVAGLAGGARTLASTVLVLRIAGSRHVAASGARTAAAHFGYLGGGLGGGLALAAGGYALLGLVLGGLSAAAALVLVVGLRAQRPALRAAAA